ncbi:MAG: hypothetical protein NTW10_01875 [Bacteroidetes bacterium]|nr:hypothetical protein [Bacteroidota bacterium]
MKKIILSFVLLLLFSTCTLAQFDGGIGRGDFSIAFSDPSSNANIILVAGSNGANGYYSSLSNASGAFSAVNGKDQSGEIITVIILGNSTSEAGTIGLTEGAWTTLTIYPTSTNLIISGTAGGPHITVDGADRVTIDGRVNASGAIKSLTISNIRFINTSIGNKIKYCSITGDLSMSGSSYSTMEGEMTVGGNLTLEGESMLSTSSTSTLTVSGIFTLLP